MRRCEKAAVLNAVAIRTLWSEPVINQHRAARNEPQKAPSAPETAPGSVPCLRADTSGRHSPLRGLPSQPRPPLGLHTAPLGMCKQQHYTPPPNLSNAQGGMGWAPAVLVRAAVGFSGGVDSLEASRLSPLSTGSLLLFRELLPQGETSSAFLAGPRFPTLGGLGYQDEPSPF